MSSKIDSRYGQWMVLREVDDLRPGKHYECQCDCGTVTVIPGTTLRAGRSTKCKECMYRARFPEEAMVGRRFGKWVVIRPVEIRNRYWIYWVRCDCGNEKDCYGSDLRSGKTSQCVDCHNRSNASKNVTHGGSGSPLYKVWCSMHSRCSNPTDRAYRWYGARGIRVCERWNDFSNFQSDMAPRPTGMTIDRTDNDSGYSKENCRWVTHKENCQNRRKTYTKSRLPLQQTE